MAQNKKSPQEELVLNKIPLEEKKKKKKKRFFILLFSIIGFFVLCGVALALILSSQTPLKKSNITNLNVTIDPIVVTSQGENHINGAQKFSFGENEEKNKECSAHIEVLLNYQQYIYYSYGFENNGTTNVKIKLDVSLDKIENASLSYSVNDGEVKGDINQNITELTIKPEEKTNIKVFMKIDNINEDAIIKGTFHLFLSEEVFNDEQNNW